MPTGVVLAPNSHAPNVVDDVVDQARRAHEIGVQQIWLAQQLDFDGIALSAIVAPRQPAWRSTTRSRRINR